MALSNPSPSCPTFRCAPHQGVDYDDKLKKELVMSVREQIGAFAAPDVIHWAPGLPKTRSGAPAAAGAGRAAACRAEVGRTPRAVRCACSPPACLQASSCCCRGSDTRLPLPLTLCRARPDAHVCAPAGKIMRRVLRKIASFEEDQLGDTSTLADPGVVDTLLELRGK